MNLYFYEAAGQVDMFAYTFGNCFEVHKIMKGYESLWN